MNYGYLIASLLLNAVANILLKVATLGDRAATLRALITNPYAIAGVLIFASNIYLYIQAMKNLPVSLVYPVQTAAGFLIINSFGILVLKEPFSAWSVAGYALIVVGLALVMNAYR